MNILVVCQYYYPEEFQVNSICEELVSRGYSVTVLTGLPNYPTGVIPEEYSNGKRRNEIINGVKIVRVWEIPRGKGIFNLGLNYVSYCLAASMKAFNMKLNFDVVYVYQLSPILMAIPGVIIKALTKKKLYLYCCDLWPESLKVYRIDEGSIIFKVTSLISKAIYKNCDYIGVQSKAFIHYFNEKHNIDKSKLVYIPQFAEDTYLSEDFTVEQGKQMIDFVFLGNIGKIQNLDCTVAASEILQQHTNDFRIHIVGDGSYLEELKLLAQKSRAADKFIFYGRRPNADMAKFYKMADACLLTLAGDSMVGQTIPSKLQGYMAAGKPVIAAINGPAKDVIEEAECGLVVSAGDYIGFANAMKTFIFYEGCKNDFGKNGRKYFIKKFSKEKYIGDTLEIMEKLLKR